jgi:NAD-reducing hydrogenase large subunit
VHGTAAIPGGVNKHISREERSYLLKEIDQIIDWSVAAVGLAKRLFVEDIEHSSDFALIDTNMLSLIRDDGALDLYHGGLRATKPDGSMVFDHVDYRDYEQHIHEQVKSWSYMKFPYMTALGKEQGAYRVGPLARINNCDFIETPLAEAARADFRAFAGGGLMQSTLAYHWARMIELLFCAEGIKALLNDPDLLGNDLVVRGEMQARGIGVIEAPRGTLFHHYEIDDNGIVTRANLIVSTTNNNTAMNESIRRVANDLFDGRELNEAMLNSIEVAIRAYDPCLSCATHALGKMPLEIQLVAADGSVRDKLYRHMDGAICQVD